MSFALKGGAVVVVVMVLMVKLKMMDHGFRYHRIILACLDRLTWPTSTVCLAMATPS